jgi:hypothetical protein
MATQTIEPLYFIHTFFIAFQLIPVILGYINKWRYYATNSRDLGKARITFLLSI